MRPDVSPSRDLGVHLVSNLDEPMWVRVSVGDLPVASGFLVPTPDDAARLSAIVRERDEWREGQARALRDREDVEVEMDARLSGIARERDRLSRLVVALAAVADDAQAEYVAAMSELESLQPGTREHGEWAANALIESEVRDRVRAAMTEVGP